MTTHHLKRGHAFDEPITKNFKPDKNTTVCILRAVTRMNTNTLKLRNIQHMESETTKLVRPVNNHLIPALGDRRLPWKFDSSLLKVTIGVLKCIAKKRVGKDELTQGVISADTVTVKAKLHFQNPFFFLEDRRSRHKMYFDAFTGEHMPGKAYLLSQLSTGYPHSAQPLLRSRSLSETYCLPNLTNG